MKAKTKKEIIEGLIITNEEEILRLEIVRDFNAAVDVPEAKVQVDAANNGIKKCEVQLTFLREHLSNLK